MTDAERKQLGERIKSARIRAGLKQIELSRLVGIAQPNFSMYEKGTCSASVKIIVYIPQACGVSPDYLLGLSDEMVSVDSGLRSGAVTLERIGSEFILRTSDPELSEYLNRMS